jgi:SAM-dependent methyltransferase
LSRYEPRTYWEELLGREYNLRGVAYPELPESFNARFYRVSEAAARRALRRAGFVAGKPPGRVLDAGAGTGAWIDFWSRLGARKIVGVDLTETAVARLSAQYPEHRFVRADVSGAALPVDPPFDAVSAMSVLLHIPDEGAFERAVRNLARVLRPGGIALVMDPIVVHRWWGTPFTDASNSRVRSLDEWRRVFDAAELDIVALEPVTWLFANPIDTRHRATFRLLSAYWRVTSRLVSGRERTGTAVSTAAAALDAALVRLGKAGPSTKCLVGRRRPPG